MSEMLTLQDIERAKFFYQQGYWQDDTLYTVLRDWAERQPGGYALRDTYARLTYRETVEWVDAIAEDLHESGLRPGDRVSVWLSSRIEIALVFLACSRMGYACNPSLHRDYSCADVVALLERIGTAGFFMQPGYGADADRNNILEMVGDLASLKKIYQIQPHETTGPEAEGCGYFSIKQKRDSDLAHATSPDRITFLAFTSGTTGLPKGVMHSNNSLLSNGRAIVKDWSFDTDTVVYALSPLSHNIGIVGLVVSLVSGGEFVVHTPLDAERTLDRIIETDASYLLGVPTHAIDLLSEIKSRGLDTLGNVTSFQLGGAPVPAATVRGLAALGVGIQNAFGMTENCSFQYTRPDDTLEIVANTCGRSCDGFEIRLWREDDPDEEADPGEGGEIGARGASMMLGYFDDQKNTEAAFNRHGWFMTGDLGRLDGHGNLTILGRKKDLIIRGGHNIYPARIEDYAMSHDRVVKAAAFAVQDDRLGERVCLAVIADGASDMDPDDVLRHLNGRGLSKYHMPEYFIQMASFPLTASGKVLKRRLVEMVAEGELKPTPVRWVS